MNRPLTEQNRHYAQVAKAIRYIRAHARQQPSLSEIADAVGLSEYHLQRIFSEWAGISPKRFLQYLTKEHARQVLQQSKDVFSAALESGLSSAGRLHDLMISCEAMSPGEIRQAGLGLTVCYGLAGTPFGNALIGWTTRGICKLAFCDNGFHEMEQALFKQWPAAKLVRNDDEAIALSNRIFGFEPKPGKLHLLLRGTNFQIKVWEALIDIPPAQIISYSTLASLTGSPRAQRAVGTAMAANHIGFLIPCHRVIRENGDIGIYHWSAERKAAMLVWETGK